MKPGDRVRYRDRDITRRAVILAIGEKRITVSFYRYGRPVVSKVRPYTVTPWATADDAARMIDAIDEALDAGPLNV